MASAPSGLAPFINNVLRLKGTMGAAAAAFDRDGLLYTTNAGYADLARADRPTETTIFRCASISKIVTLTLVHRLVERGLIDLDASVNTYTDEKTRLRTEDGEDSNATIADLLSHASGLPAGIKGVRPGNPVISFFANAGVVNSLTDAVSGLVTKYPTGERFIYSNPGFNLLGHICAELLGVSFEEAASREVLKPLGMDSSEFRGFASGPGVATTYGDVLVPAQSRRPIKSLHLAATPMGGMTSTVSDLVALGRMLLNKGATDNGRLLKASTVEQACQIRTKGHPDLDQGYGGGLQIRSWRGRTLVGHDGNMPGVATELRVSPDDGLGVIVLTNGFDRAVPHTIAHWMWHDLLGLESEREPGSPKGVPHDQRAPWKAFTDEVVGRYVPLDAGPPGIIDTAMRMGAKVAVRHDADCRLRLEGGTMVEPTWLYPDGEVGRYRLQSGVWNGSAAVIERRDDGMHIYFAGEHLHKT